MYTYDENGKKKTETLNSHTTQYDCDELNRLINKQMADGSRTTYTFTCDVNDRMSTESYDPNGNTTLSGARTFTYNFENRLKTMNGGAVMLVYRRRWQSSTERPSQSNLNFRSPPLGAPGPHYSLSSESVRPTVPLRLCTTRGARLSPR
jgi:YD repeat-containing protein